MKKVYKVVLLFILMLAMFLVPVSLIPVKAAVTEAYQIIANPGENMANEVNINWHSDIEGTFVEYTLKTESDYTNAVRVAGQCEALDFHEPGDTWTVYGFSERNVCRATLTKLTPDTQYKYRVGKTVFSKDYSFKTAGSGSFSFINMSDPQFYGSASAQVWYDLMADAVSINKKVAFTLLNGDVVNSGNEGAEWNMFFANQEISQMMVASAAGNHEYYAGGTTTIDARFYNAHFNNPKNGASNVINSSYFFIYNNALFIVLDSQKTENGTWATQKAWFEEVVKAHPTQYIIVSSHVSVYGGANSSNADVFRRAWLSLFDKYGVDLVLTGHDHIYARSKKIYNNQETTDRFKGTYYIIGGVAGSGTKYNADNLDKSKMDQWYEFKTSYGIVTVASGNITYRCYDKDKNVIDLLMISSKRTGNASETFDKEDFLANLQIVTDDSNRSTARFNWPSTAYGYVDTIRLYNDKNALLESRFINIDNDNYFAVSGLELNKDYQYKAVIDFRDGTTVTKPINFSTSIYYGDIEIVKEISTDQGILIQFNSNLRSDLLGEVTVSLNGKPLNSFNAKLTTGEILLPRADLEVNNEIIFVATSKADDSLVVLLQFSKAIDLEVTLDKSDFTLEIEEQAKAKLSIFPQGTYSPRVASENEAIAIANIVGNEIVITAIGSGQTTIQVTIGNQELFITIKVNKAIEPETPIEPEQPIVEPKEPEVTEEPKEPEKPESSTGCNSAAVTFIFSGLGLLAFFIRRRRFF